MRNMRTSRTGRSQIINLWHHNEQKFFWLVLKDSDKLSGQKSQKELPEHNWNLSFIQSCQCLEQLARSGSSVRNASCVRQCKQKNNLYGDVCVFKNIYMLVKIIQDDFLSLSMYLHKALVHPQHVCIYKYEVWSM